MLISLGNVGSDGGAMVTHHVTKYGAMLAAVVCAALLDGCAMGAVFLSPNSLQL